MCILEFLEVYKNYKVFFTNNSAANNANEQYDENVF